MPIDYELQHVCLECGLDYRYHYIYFDHNPRIVACNIRSGLDDRFVGSNGEGTEYLYLEITSMLRKLKNKLC